MAISGIMDRVANILGYCRIPDAVNEPPGAPGAAVPVLHPHLAAEAQFDYQRVENPRDWAFYYDHEGAFHFAVGRHAWMPALMAGFIVGGNATNGMNLLSSAIADRLWLRGDAPAHAAWIEGNRPAVERISSLTFSHRDGHDDAVRFDPAMFLDLSATVVSSELRTMWRRHRPHRPEAWLSATRAHNLLCQLPWMQAAAQAPEHALDQLLDLTLEWFDAHDFAVDRGQRLVAVPEYQPLFHIDSDPGAF